MNHVQARNLRILDLIWIECQDNYCPAPCTDSYVVFGRTPHGYVLKHLDSGKVVYRDQYELGHAHKMPDLIAANGRFAVEAALCLKFDRPSDFLMRHRPAFPGICPRESIRGLVRFS